VKRAVALLVALALAAVVAWRVARGGDPSGAAACAEVENRLREGDAAGAAKLAAAARPRLPPHVARYLDALLALSAGKDEEARVAAEEAATSAPGALDDWRVVSILFFSRLNTGRSDGAWQALEAYLLRHADDERALAAAAQYWVEARPTDPDPDRAKEYLDRIDRLPARRAPAGDPTAVTPDQLARLRSVTEQLRGHLASAVAAAEARVKAAPQDPDARAQLGEAYRVARRLEQARQAFRDAVRLAPGNPVYAKQLALLLLETTDTGDELEPLTRSLLEAAPGDPSVRVLRARALVRTKDGTDEAIDIYRALLADPALPTEVRRDVCRNLAVALYDWIQGGKPGDYLDEAHTLLREYLQLGGKIDLRLADVWDRLEARAKAKGAAPK
jgi:tetratricopeptide (TPR) repeat protein